MLLMQIQMQKMMLMLMLMPMLMPKGWDRGRGRTVVNYLENRRTVPQESSNGVCAEGSTVEKYVRTYVAVIIPQ